MHRSRSRKHETFFRYFFKLPKVFIGNYLQHLVPFLFVFPRFLAQLVQIEAFKSGRNSFLHSYQNICVLLVGLLGVSLSLGSGVLARVKTPEQNRTTRSLGEHQVLHRCFLSGIFICRIFGSCLSLKVPHRPATSVRLTRPGRGIFLIMQISPKTASSGRACTRFRYAGLRVGGTCSLAHASGYRLHYHASRELCGCKKVIWV